MTHWSLSVQLLNYVSSCVSVIKNVCCQLCILAQTILATRTKFVIGVPAFTSQQRERCFESYELCNK